MDSSSITEMGEGTTTESSERSATAPFEMKTETASEPSSRMEGKELITTTTTAAADVAAVVVAPAAGDVENTNISSLAPFLANEVVSSATTTQISGKKRSRSSESTTTGTTPSTANAAAPILTYNALLALLYTSSSSSSSFQQHPVISVVGSSTSTNGGFNGSTTTGGGITNISTAANSNTAMNALVTLSSGTAMLASLPQLQLHMIPDTLNITNLTNKAINDIPPYVHLNPRDSNPSLVKMLDQSKLSLHFTGSSITDYPLSSSNTSPNVDQIDVVTTTKWALGYRMIRASHGISPPPPKTPFVHYYYEVVVSSPQPTCAQIKAGLPKNTRIGYGLTKELSILAKLEQRQRLAMKSDSNEAEGEEAYKTITELIHETTNGTSLMLGSHIRLGFSMRTGDLNAPVGYDKWSYAVRDVRGSRIHQSKREDNWGRGYNVSFGPGDVIGCWITLVSAESGEKRKIEHGLQGNLGVCTNQIRFFCNGKSLGALDAVGKTRTGGEAFDNITSGTYYPAISTYMGGSVRVNFGPYFIYTPKQSQLPSGRDYNMNNLRPISDLCAPPPTLDEAVEMALKGRNFGKKTDENVIEKFKEAVRTESGLRREAWEKNLNRHVEFVKTEREIRGINFADLPLVHAPETLSKDLTEAAIVAPSSLDAIASIESTVPLSTLS
jgi:hypothetical protein